ncbi:hypothetical protein BX600DRAFT_513944 [Xylariales sp. PMI_506]|nr:hypothetical protein BX600DRAFT_513944 [Xylariales sp. PMI_506]
MGILCSAVYTRLPLISSASSSSDRVDHEIENQKTQFLDGEQSQRWSRPGRSQMQIAITILNLVAFAIWALLSLRIYIDSYRLNAKLRQVSTWSPLHDLVDLKLQTVTANGDLYPGDNRPVGRQMPNPEADAIWNEWEFTRVFPIHADEVLRLGKDLETAVLLEDKYYGLGDNVYAATLDIYHQLHCLNQLRWIAYGSYYNRSMLDPHEEGFREVHINHCVDMLAQTIQCTGNLNLITMHWTETKSFPFPDMSINHKCVDFDALTEWRKENTVDMDVWSHLTANISLRPNGTTMRPPPDEEYNKIYGHSQ